MDTRTKITIALLSVIVAVYIFAVFNPQAPMLPASCVSLLDGSEISCVDTTVSGAKTEWVPKSQVEDNGDGTFTMPEWLAKEKGFI